MNKHVKEYLNYYIKLDNPRFAIMISGNWGCGKTFFIKNVMNEWAKSSDAEDVKINPIYISLNGISSINQIKDLIRKQVSPFLYSKGIKIAKNILLGLVKTTVKIDLDFNNDDDIDGDCSLVLDPLDLFDIDNKEIRNDRIIVFDDVERCKIDIDEIFGFINNFVEHKKCKVILLNDENKIKDKYEKKESKEYNSFKEKLIGKTFKIEPEIEKTLVEFIEEIDGKDILLKDLDSIIELFKISKTENLRILRHSLFDYLRLKDLLDKKLKNNDNYEDFLSKILNYFLIIYFEYKNGNVDIAEFQNNYLKSEDEKENKVVYELKYRDYLIKKQLPDSSYLFELKYLKYFIENGFVDNDMIEKAVRNCVLFKQNVEQGWERLWFWKIISQEEFNILYKKVWSDFESNKIQNIFEVFHIAGIYLDMIEKRVSKKKRKTVVENAEKNIKRILKDCKETYDYTDTYYFNDSYGKEYLSKESEEFLKLVEYYKSEINILERRIYITKIHEIFYELDENKIRNIKTILDEVTPDNKRVYEYTPFFQFVDGKKLAKIIRKSEPIIPYKFKYYLIERYFVSYENRTLKQLDKIMDEKQFLFDLRKELSKVSNIKGEIMRFNILDLLREINNIIDEIEKIDMP